MMSDFSQVIISVNRVGRIGRVLHDHQVKDEGGRVTGYRARDRIGETLAPVMIRRRKSEVLRQLPSRTDQNVLVPMTEPQMDLHRENADTVAKIVQRWRKIKFLSDKDQRRLTCALQNMRMSCNSTYLLDQESDHGVKADELAAVLDQLLAAADAKAVVFSQWTRTHDIVIRRLQARGIGYVSFHGGVPSEKRPELVQRFRDDPACRVFLSTDAGSTGLNLQHASTLVNMDLPWNPAVLEQRIARIHRLGQIRPVQIVNFVAKGTIEEGMLSVLAFKRSLSEGILDGGSNEVSLGGSRLNRFMKDVESVTGSMGSGEAVTTAEEAGPANGVNDAGAPGEALVGQAEAATMGSRDVSSDPWQALVQMGTQFIGAIAAANGSGSAPHPWLERDPASGSQSLRIPLPSPETASRLGDLLAELARTLRGGTA